MSAPAHPDLRSALLDQVAYLLEEVEALRPIVDRIPEPLQVARPLGKEPSIREYYGLIADRDAHERLAWVQQQTGTAPSVGTADTDWNALPMRTILDRLAEARTQLTQALRSLPDAAWATTGAGSAYAFVHTLLQEDTDVLRTLGYRMHESHMTSRNEDLPK
ncbi:MAG: DinB family protein [Bacteroidota bacterium]